MLQPSIVDKPELKVVGLEASFIHGLSPNATNFKVIPPLWDKFLPRSNQVPHRIGKEMLGVIYERPEAERSLPDELQYMATVPVSSIGQVPDGMSSRTIPAGTFAVFIHRGPIQNIADTCREIYRVWLPQSGYEHAGIADIEVYDHRFCPDGDDSEMEYWISVRSKS